MDRLLERACKFIDKELSASHEARLIVSSELVNFFYSHLERRYRYNDNNTIEVVSELDCRDGPTPAKHYLVVKRKE
ncbi:MAG TPA: hypothetical protein VMC80_00645 [Patescibacteria group bacterium]|nr:hypothetical protein [Patescibacteria group bacterium]